MQYTLTKVNVKYSTQKEKMQYDDEFPKPIAIINTRVLFFTEDDIIFHEGKHKELTDANQKRYLKLTEDLNIFLNIKIPSNQD